MLWHVDIAYIPGPDIETEGLPLPARARAPIKFPARVAGYGETIATGRGGAGKAADTDAKEERMTEIGVWAIVILLAVIAYVVGRRDWAHERQISAVLTSLSDTYRTGFNSLTATVQRLEERVKALENRR